MSARLTAAVFLLTALARPAVAEDDALQTLYAPDRPATKSGLQSKVDARAHSGDHGPLHAASLQGRVRSVLHVHRAADGRLVTGCRIERAGGNPGTDVGARSPGGRR